MNKSPLKNYFEYIIIAILTVLFLGGVTVYSYYSFRNLDDKKLQLTSELEFTIRNNDVAIYQPQIGKIKELISAGDLVNAKLEISSLSSDIYIVRKAAEIMTQKREADRLTEENKAADEKAKQEEANRLGAYKKPTVSTYRAPAVAAGSCSKNELYVVVNVTSNTENIWKGDPDCRTGEVIETRKVSTGRSGYCKNDESNESYLCATPLSKWVIYKRTSYGGAYGPYFLGIRDLNGGWGDYYGLHGTDEEYKIGTHASAGCVRHYNDDIIHLYNLLPKGTIVWTE